MKRIFLIIYLLFSCNCIIDAQELLTGELVIIVKNNPGYEIQIQVDLASSLCWDASDNPAYYDIHDLTTEYPGSYQTTSANEDLNWEGCWSYPHYQHAFGLGNYKVTACLPGGNEEEDCAILDYFYIDYRTSDLPENFNTGGQGDVIVDFNVSTGNFYYTGTQNLFPTHTSIWEQHSWIDSITTELEPLPPENLDWYNFSNYPRLQWSPSSNTEDFGTHYEIHRYTSQGWELIDTRPAILLYYVDWEVDLSAPEQYEYLYYKVRAKNGNRTSDEFSNTVIIFSPGTLRKDSGGINSEDDKSYEYKLEQNHPNPFNPTTLISFSLKDETNVTLNIFDILGNKVKTLIDKRLAAGDHQVEFDGSQLKSGIYFYEIRTEKFRDIRKLVLVK